MDSDDFRDYEDKLTHTDYEILRTSPKVAKLAQLAAENTLDQGNFPYLGEQPDNTNRFGHSKITGLSKMKGKLRRRWQNKKDVGEPQSKLIIFVIGGLSHHEIVALNTMQAEQEIDCMIIQGGNDIMTPKRFLSGMKKMGKSTVSANLDGMPVNEDSIIDHDQIGVDLT